MVVLDGHKSHMTLKVIIKTKQHGIDLIILSSHELQSMNMTIFVILRQL